MSQVPPRRLIAPAVVLDVTAEAAKDADFLLEVEHVRAWEAAHGAAPGRRLAAVPHRAGTPAPAMPAAFANEGHTPGISIECARWLAEEAPVQGVGVETVGTDAGAAHSFDPPFPCHSFLLGSDKYGLTQLQNLARLPATGAVVIAGPLPIVGGSGSPCRVLALDRTLMNRRRGGRPVAGRATACGTSSAWSAAATSTSPTRSWPAAPGSSPPRTRPAPRAWPTPTPGSRAGRPCSPCIRDPA